MENPGHFWVEINSPVNACKEIELAVYRLNFRDIDMKEADGIALKLLALWLVSFDIRQARDAVPLKVRRVRKRSEGSFSQTQDAVPIGSDAESIAEGHRGNHPAAAACAVGMRR